jgi:serine/threonine protein kinase
VVRYIDSKVVSLEEERSEVLILTEICEGGTLLDLLERHRFRLSEVQIIAVMREIVAGVKAIHQVGIAHRDLKVENVLLQGS